MPRASLRDSRRFFPVEKISTSQPRAEKNFLKTSQRQTGLVAAAAGRVKVGFWKLLVVGLGN